MLEQTETPPRSARAEWPQRHEASRLRAVRGWLLLFCIQRLVLAPIWLWAVFLEQGTGRAAAETFRRSPPIEHAWAIECAVMSGLTLYGCAVGLAVLLRSSRGKRIALRYLKFRLAAVIVVQLALLAILSPLPSKLFTAHLGSALGVLLGETILFVLWSQYFQRSKRVAAIFDSKP